LVGEQPPQAAVSTYSWNRRNYKMRMLCTIVGLAICWSMGSVAFAAEKGAMKLGAAQCSTLWDKVNITGGSTIDASQAQG
jgi:hypothetical protein